MIYYLCQFDYGYEGQFYQRSDINGSTVFFDLNGNVLELLAPYGYRIIDDVSVLPAWALNE